MRLHLQNLRLQLLTIQDSHCSLRILHIQPNLSMCLHDALSHPKAAWLTVLVSTCHVDVIQYNPLPDLRVLRNPHADLACTSFCESLEGTFSSHIALQIGR